MYDVREKITLKKKSERQDYAVNERENYTNIAIDCLF